MFVSSSLYGSLFQVRLLRLFLCSSRLLGVSVFSMSLLGCALSPAGFCRSVFLSHLVISMVSGSSQISFSLCYGSKIPCRLNTFCPPLRLNQGGCRFIIVYNAFAASRPWKDGEWSELQSRKKILAATSRCSLTPPSAEVRK